MVTIVYGALAGAVLGEYLCSGGLLQPNTERPYPGFTEAKNRHSVRGKRKTMSRSLAAVAAYCAAACVPLNSPAATSSPTMCPPFHNSRLCSNIERWWRGLTWRISRRSHTPCNEIESVVLAVIPQGEGSQPMGWMKWGQETGGHEKPRHGNPVPYMRG